MYVRYLVIFFHSAAPRSNGPSPPPVILFRHLKMNVDFKLVVPHTVKNLPAIWETGFASWVRKIPWRREWQPTPLFFPGEFQGQWSSEGYVAHGVTQSWRWLSDTYIMHKRALLYFIVRLYYLISLTIRFNGEWISENILTGEISSKEL